MRLLLIIGPPAVGKMTVGREIAAQSDFRLFHNHHTIEPLIEVFGYGTVPFNVLNIEFRRRVIEEAARNSVDLILPSSGTCGTRLTLPTLNSSSRRSRMPVVRYACSS